MSWEKQHEFVFKVLEKSAALVGISVEQSWSGLLEVVDRLDFPDRDWLPDPDGQVEADRLMSKIGSTEEGVNLLHALGDACNFAYGPTWVERGWDQPISADNCAESMGWSCLEERALCDFAMFVGIAEAACRSFMTNDSGTKTRNPAAELARRRHAENYAMVDDALKYWREKIDPAISASKAANELVRVVPLSHKKLAQVIAAEKKKQI